MSSDNMIPPILYVYNPFDRMINTFQAYYISHPCCRLVFLFFEIVFFTVIFFAYCSYLSKHSHEGPRYLIIPAILIAIGGAVVHWVGYYPDGPKELFAPITRSIISSLDLFISDTHLSDIKEPKKEDPIWMFFYMLFYSLALVTSMFMIFELLFKRMTSRWWLRKKESKASTGKWYLFFGIDNHSIMLAKDIAQNPGNEECTIVFVDSPKDNVVARRYSFIDILRGDHRSGVLKKRLKQEIPDAIILDAKEDISKAGTSEKHDAFDAIGLSSLKLWLNNEDAEIFLISSNTEDNLNALSNILNGSKKVVKAKIYCQTRRNDYSRRVQLCADANVSIVDSSHLAVQNLIKTHPELHPVHYVDIKHDASVQKIRIPSTGEEISLPDGLKMGYVTSEFNAMIVGFGEMGQEALSYLYEFGAFSDGKRKRSRFNCYVIDKDMDSIEGIFRSQCPAALHDSLIHYEKDCPESVSFWKNLEKRIENLNYVFVSLGNDELSMSVGLQILEYAKKHRKGMNNFIVLVRNYSYDKDSEQMENIYNENLSDDGRTVFKCFAKKHDIWKYDVISNESLSREAEVYRNNYLIAAKDGYDPKEWSAINKERNHILHQRVVTEKLRQTPKEMPLYIAMADDRMIMQDYSNVLHAPTKQELCDKQLFGKEEILQHIPIVAGYPEDNDAKPHYVIDDNLSAGDRKVEELFSSVLSHLADTEHIRWMASHEIRGCSWGPNKNEITREHPGMVDCDELKSGSTIHYDWIVVKQSMKMS